MTEEQQLLQSAAAEIRTLRQRNQFLETRLSGFEDAMKLLNTAPYQPGQGMSPDIAWQIDKLLTQKLAVDKAS